MATVYNKSSANDCKQVPKGFCWCGGGLQSVFFHPDYCRCKECGTYISNYHHNAESYKEFYGFQNYWIDWQKKKGCPIIYHRIENDIQDGRVDYWINMIKKYAPQKGLAIEVGCAHGILLKRLEEQNWKTLGVEVSEEVAKWTQKTLGIEVMSGIFPNISLPQCDLFLAMDVIEHSTDPMAFVRKIYDVLNHNGIAIIQAPLDQEVDYPPFQPRVDAVFDHMEHLHLFTRNSIARLFSQQSFQVMANYESWRLGHEIIVVKKKIKTSLKSSRLSLASIEETFSPSFKEFMDSLNQFASRHGLRQFFDWSRVWEYPWLWFNGLAEQDWHNQKHLDMGSELSPFPWFLASLGADVTLVEKDTQFVETWERIKKETGLSVHWEIVPDERLPFEKNSFSSITSFSVIAHQTDQQLAVDEVARVLRPGGIFALSFDICEPDMGMTFPEWNGRALTIKEFESLIWQHSTFDTKSKIPEWNLKDCPSFIKWHLQSASHHNYIVGAAVVKKIE